MALAVEGAIFPVAIGLVDWLVTDRGSLRRCEPEVGVDIVDHDGHARRGSAGRLRRQQTMLGKLRMQPEDPVTRLHLTVDDPASVVTRQFSRP